MGGVHDENPGDIQPADLMPLPPGFRFYPTDAEVILEYLTKKVLNKNFSPQAMDEVDLNKCEPWDLPKLAKMGGENSNELYFFSHKEQKYPTGTRTNRATKSGYWKATGKDKEICQRTSRNSKSRVIGMKKTLVFYTGRAPKGQKTNWVMNEYRLEGKSFPRIPESERDRWVVCKVIHRKQEAAEAVVASKKKITETDEVIPKAEFLFNIGSQLPPLMDSPNCYPNNNFASTSKTMSSCGDFMGFNGYNSHNAIATFSSATPTFASYPNYPSIVPAPILYDQCKEENFSATGSNFPAAVSTGISPEFVVQQQMGSNILLDDDGEFINFIANNFVDIDANHYLNY